jgi:hypothetical protein
MEGMRGRNPHDSKEKYFRKFQRRIARNSRSREFE